MMEGPETKLGNRKFCRFQQGWRTTLLLLFFATQLVGCGTSAKMVKENLDPKPILASAISKAASLTCPLTAQKTEPEQSKRNGFPSVPMDQDSPVVRKFVKEYAYGQRETMKRYLAQAEQYLPMVKAMARENGLPEELSYLFLLESGANPEARSAANALGMWQFMPATARNYGLKVDTWVDERLDPRKSTQAALVYLKDLYGMFGCWRLALSAYNSGENKMNKVLCQEDANEYNEICGSRKLRRETREFLPRFQAISHIAKNPERYGFAQLRDRVDQDDFETTTIEGSYSFERLAGLMGVSQEALLELNPAFIRGCTPPDSHHPVRIPFGKKEILVAKLKDLPEEQPERHIVHVVHKGDSLHKILKQYGVARVQLASLNPDVNLHRRLKPGSKIVIPSEKHQVKAKNGKKTKRLSYNSEHRSSTKQ
jgi:membrane-bound lytic murein transglycosylase D